MAENNRNWNQQSENKDKDWNQDKQRSNQFDQEQHHRRPTSYENQLRGGHGGSEYGNTYYRADYYNDEHRVDTGNRFRNSYGSSDANGQQDQYNQRQGGYGNQSDNYGGGSYGNDHNPGYGRVGNTGGSSHDTGRQRDRRENDEQRFYGNTGNDYRQDRSKGSRDDDNWLDRASGKLPSWNEGNKASGGEHRGKGPKGYQRSADRIREDVCDRLSEDPFIDASDIDIKIEGSEVVLTGTVDSKDAKRRAEDLVESISGVQHVENRIRVDRDRGANRDSRFYTNANDVGDASGTTREIIRDQQDSNKDR